MYWILERLEFTLAEPQLTLIADHSWDISPSRYRRGGYLSLNAIMKLAPGKRITKGYREYLCFLIL